MAAVEHPVPSVPPPDVSFIDDLPLPSTLDLPSSPNYGILPSLTQSTNEMDVSVLNPLPPPMPIDNYALQYGPSSVTEPQLEPTRTDGELPQFDELNDQYDFLRRTLSHSRRRYSARYKRPRPKPQSQGENELGTSLDMPGQKRTESDYPRIPPPGSHPLAHHHQHHTVRGTNVGDDFRRPRKVEGRRSEYVASSRRTHVDSLGRHYRLDHNTHTVQYDTPTSEQSDNMPEYRERREMLNRRYESLNRSFRSAHHLRRSQHHGIGSNLSPIESVGAITYLPNDIVSGRDESGHTSTPAPIPQNKSKSEKKGSWFSSFVRRSNRARSITQSSSSSDTGDNIIPITSPDILSPITPPPLLDSLDSSLPPAITPTLSNVAAHDNVVSTSEPESVLGSMEVDNRSEDAETRNRDSVTAILGAMNVDSTQTQPRPQSEVSNERDIPTSPTRRTTDLNRARAAQAQRRISAGRRMRQDGHGSGEDTDEETDIRSPRSSVTTPDSTSRDNNSPSVVKIEDEEDLDKTGEGELKRRTTRGSRRKLSKGLEECPALRFITRPDLYSFLNSSGEAGTAFFSNKSLVELVQRIRTENNLFEKYQHSRHLVKALNAFAYQDSELPNGWEKKLNRQGRVFFIDHVNKITTFIDPRLPKQNEDNSSNMTTPLQLPQNVRRVYSVSDEPVMRPHHSTITQSLSLPDDLPDAATTENEQNGEQASYEAQIVAFLRQPDTIDKINERYMRGVRPNLAEAIEDIRQNGVPGLERIQLEGGTAAYELGLILSLFDEEVNAVTPQTSTTPQITVNPPPTPEHKPNATSTLQNQKQAFSAKLQTFKLQLARLGFAQSSRLKFNLRREHLLEDSYEHVLKSEIRHLQRKRLNIAFRGEDGLDYGGPSREFFFLVSREIFNPYFGLFEYSANDTYTVQISSTSCFIRNNLDWFRFAGRLIGLVIAQGFLLDAFFTRPFYKMLLKRPPMLKDIESLEPAFYSSLLWIKENDPAPLDLTFTVEKEAFGQLTTEELKKGGTDIPVLEENKMEYIELMIKWRLDRGTQEQSLALMKGFNEIMPVSLIQQFDAQELEFIIAGTLEIDIEDWRTHTDYRNGYHANHPVILWFWKAVEMFDNEQRLRLLQFITGTSSVPYEGFKALRGSSGPKRFTVDYFNDVRSLPRSHTCFNRLDLPPYPSFEILYEKLRVAVEEGGTFGAE